MVLNPGPLDWESSILNTRRKNMKWKKVKGKQTSEGKKLVSKGGLTKSFNDSSLNSLIKKDEFSTSKVTEWNQSIDIALERVLENDFHHMRFNSLLLKVD